VNTQRRQLAPEEAGVGRPLAVHLIQAVVILLMMMKKRMKEKK
jgi:hypothetical protein